MRFVLLILLIILFILIFMLIFVNVTSIFTKVTNGIALTELAISIILSLFILDKIGEKF